MRCDLRPLRQVYREKLPLLLNAGRERLTLTLDGDVLRLLLWRQRQPQVQQQ